MERLERYLVGKVTAFGIETINGEVYKLKPARGRLRGALVTFLPRYDEKEGIFYAVNVRKLNKQVKRYALQLALLDVLTVG